MSIPAPTLKRCSCCDKPVKGRIDKKFCDDYCRNHFNNQRKISNLAVVKQINNALSRNRRILEKLLPEGAQTAKVQKEKFLLLGYQFRYCTHVNVNRKGVLYHYCYEFGYLTVDEEYCLVVREKEEYERSGG